MRNGIVIVLNIEDAVDTADGTREDIAVRNVRAADETAQPRDKMRWCVRHTNMLKMTIAAADRLVKRMKWRK